MKLILFFVALLLLSIAFGISYSNCADKDISTLSDNSRRCDFSWLLLSGCLFISTFWMFRYCPNAWAIVIGFTALTALVTVKVQGKRMSYLHILFVVLSFLITIGFLACSKMFAVMTTYGVLLVSFIVGMLLKDNGMTMIVEFISFVLNLYVVFFLIPEGTCCISFMKNGEK